MHNMWVQHVPLRREPRANHGVQPQNIYGAPEHGKPTRTSNIQQDSAKVTENARPAAFSESTPPPSEQPAEAAAVPKL